MKLKTKEDGMTITLVPTKRVRAAIAENGVVPFVVSGTLMDGDGGYEVQVDIAAVQENS